MATDMKSLTTAVFITICVAMVTSFPTGAPESACASLIPDSHGPSTATGPSPYTLSLSSTTYSPDQVITITLTGALFKGFLIVGRKDNSTDQVGTFQNPPLGAQLVCAGTPGSNGITHTDNTVKSLLAFEWRAPSTSVGAITFHFTVVRGGAPNIIPIPSDYFAGLTSASLVPAGSNKVEVQRVKSFRRNEGKDTERLSFEQIIYRAKPYQYD